MLEPFECFCCTRAMVFPMALLGFWSHTNHIGDVLLRAPFFAARRTINLELNTSTYLWSCLLLVLVMILAFQNLDKYVTGIEAVRRNVVMFWGKNHGKILLGSHLYTGQHDKFSVRKT